MEHLDKGIVSLDWLTLFPNSKVQHHYQVSICLNVSKWRKAPPFRFNKLWTSQKDFDCLIKKSWWSQFQGSHMYCFTKKCKLLKEKAKIWSITRFGNIFRQLRIVEEKLKSIQSDLVHNDNCPYLIASQTKFLKK